MPLQRSSLQRMASNASIDDHFFEESTAPSLDIDDLSAFTGSGVLHNNDVEEADEIKGLEEELGAVEEKDAVAKLKVVVLTVLFVSVIGMSMAVFFYSSNNEYAQFEEMFVSDARHLFDSVGAALLLKLSTMDAFLTNVNAFAVAANTSWPYVTTPDFASRASQSLLIARGVKLSQFHFVAEEQSEQWLDYSAKNDAWVEESLRFESESPQWNASVPANYGSSDASETKFQGDWYLPLWQNFPVGQEQASYNVDGASLPLVQTSIPFLLNESFVITGIFDHPSSDRNDPASEIHMPIGIGENYTTVNGLLSMRFFWKDMFSGIEVSGSGGIVAVVTNECEETFSFELDGDQVSFLGFKDMHDESYNSLEESFSFVEFGDSFSSLGLQIGGNCTYSMNIFPTQSKAEAYQTSNPTILAIVVVIIFLFTAAHFTLYDYVVEFKNQQLMKKAARSNAIIKSLFPSTVRDRIFEADPSSQHFIPSKARLGSFLRTGETPSSDDGKDSKKSRPIADLFTDTTVMFADIAGFTAWSSVREPYQVFELLEAIYAEFDAVARKRGVFKVETIGDAYVAVTGLPEPRADHAVVMVTFARECRAKIVDITRKLETSLGPGTSELRYRFGLHSGPVTAGVLRGEKSRFQLFGDTVNTASRMESTGFANRIHLSESTAQLLVAAGKPHWIQPREDRVEAKGKGLMKTYWVDLQNVNKKAKQPPVSRLDLSEQSAFTVPEQQKNERLVSWNTAVLKNMLGNIVASRRDTPKGDSAPVLFRPEGTTVLDEVKEIIELPDFEGKASKKNHSRHANVELDVRACSELRDYVAAISQSYRGNPFHSFDHASHVLMSVSKLLSRIVAPDVVSPGNATGFIIDDGVQKSLHDHTFGITSDPLTQFACVFAALIHDVDHTGVPNAQLVKEEKELVRKYGGKSTAEQNSVDIAWDLLMSDSFKTLRRTICPTEKELSRFRQLVVNSVMATDIVDADLKNLRNDRWEKAFSSNFTESNRDRVNRRATIVIEHLIQASDVAHTMQHWHVYCKWNEKLFEEMYQAYRDGRSEQDPSEFWYQGEIGFFDHYIIPLAKKLADCGVFGVSSDEYLSYAMKNREEWERRGEAVVASYVEKIRCGEDNASNPQ